MLKIIFRIREGSGITEKYTGICIKASGIDRLGNSDHLSMDNI